MRILRLSSAVAAETFVATVTTLKENFTVVRVALCPASLLTLRLPRSGYCKCPKGKLYSS